MTSTFVVVAFLVMAAACVNGGNSCRDELPRDVDSSICDDIRSTVFVFRYAVLEIDKKVKKTVLVALKEAREILDSTSATTIEDVKNSLSGTRRKRSTNEDVSSAVRTLAEKAVTNIDVAIGIAEEKIRSSIARAVANVNIEDDSVRTQAVQLLHKILTKRSLATGRKDRRDFHADIQSALTGAAGEVEKAMKEAVTSSIREYTRIMDYFAPLLKELFQKANLKGNVDQAEQDIEKLAVNASVGFIKFFDSFSKLTIGKAIKTVEGLLVKIRDVKKTNPSAVLLVKSLLEHESRHISDAVVEATKEHHEGIRQTVIGAAEKMLKDYQTIQAIFKKNGM